MSVSPPRGTTPTGGTFSRGAASRTSSLTRYAPGYAPHVISRHLCAHTFGAKPRFQAVYGLNRRAEKAHTGFEPVPPP
jgi:hypothetical protein